MYLIFFILPPPQTNKKISKKYSKRFYKKIKNIQTNKKIFFLNVNSGKNSYIDMQLMSLCKHNIIANSSFSWWGAWLNSNTEKLVIAPRPWMPSHTSGKDIIPEKWIPLPAAFVNHNQHEQTI